ncbi:potassium-transporting ATPase subunit KdpC [Microvirga lotononidis]|uniref:Potassium-transporting ATPase KdpC subunit n=1 Tax=Microvirga lotononidis TaxID=864069 RepID=I4YPU6_9HYPH|nr:potassium-transporting ATPase subunit KdpC [Microvirga lotononidis]EIM25988.1 K+-transporting ATPase, C subunit [Microvirga lotononidis]WQO25897.1 potassium-transporting ATPase subunit KdpC [Microvirga lotononidis]
MSHLRPALVLLILFTALTGIVYPFAVTGIGQIVFPAQANGSLIVQEGRVIGSDLIGQAFTSDRYLWPRPSATSTADPTDPTKTVDAPYNAAASTGSNLGPTSQKLAERLTGAAETWRQVGLPLPIPGDAVTTSGSGLDPHISPAFAMAQAPRIAAARKLTEEQIRRVIEASTEGRAFGVFGEPRVNVLRVNQALDRLGVQGGGRDVS